MWQVVLILIGILILFFTTLILYGLKSWESKTRELQAKLEVNRKTISPKFYDPRELDALPEPVQRYFRKVLKKGQPMISAVSLEHTGTFNMSNTGEQWKSFKSKQRVITNRPGFVWDAKIHIASGVTVKVHDAYVAGKGILTAKLFGLLTVMEQPSTPELAHGELMRFFAEAAWYPTALLPSQGVMWEAINDMEATATLTDGNTAVQLVFQFDERGLINTVHSEGRFREVEGKQVPTPWKGRFWNYELCDGILIPLDGEVMWILPEGPKPYWRGYIQRIRYEYE